MIGRWTLHHCIARCAAPLGPSSAACSPTVPRGSPLLPAPRVCQKLLYTDSCTQFGGGSNPGLRQGADGTTALPERRGSDDSPSPGR
jgi:hypothetical protein